MPLYEYRCHVCGAKREEFRVISERNVWPRCNDMSHSTMPRVPSVTRTERTDCCQDIETDWLTGHRPHHIMYYAPST